MAPYGERNLERLEQLSNSGVRTLLPILETKGRVKRQEDGLRFLYKPAVSREKARRSALNHVLSIFVNGSP